MFDRKHTCVVVVGAQWGDEGKGKLVDVLAERADLVVRYQGGANAGHTVVVGEQQFILHQIPSGILHPAAACVVGNGVVLDPETLFAELDQITGQGIDISGRLFISERAHLVLPYHKLLDRASEKQQQIGTTGRGIGPTYEDKIPENLSLGGPVWPQNNIDDQCLWLYKPVSCKAHGFVPEGYEIDLSAKSGSVLDLGD